MRSGAKARSFARGNPLRTQASERRGTVYLIKDSNDLISFCNCDPGLVSIPSQLDCPWCGCGWLFSCVRCRKAFSFARAVVIPQSLEEIARADLRGFGVHGTADQVDEWLATMSELLGGIELGKRYVYLDGCFLEADSGPIAVDGSYAHHSFAQLPHVAALADRTIIASTLRSVDYWQANELPDRD